MKSAVFVQSKKILNTLLMLCLLAVAARSQQSNRGSVRGKVVDVNDAVILGANVTVTGAGGAEQKTQTNQSGEFNITLARKVHGSHHQSGLCGLRKH